MANYSATLSTHQTAASGVADVVTLDKDYAAVEVLNRNGAGALYFTVDGAAPTIGAGGTYCIPAVIGARKVTSTELATTATVVRIIASADCQYSVTGLDEA